MFYTPIESGEVVVQSKVLRMSHWELYSLIINDWKRPRKYKILAWLPHTVGLITSNTGVLYIFGEKRKSRL
jgi:hypothetical protein